MGARERHLRATFQLVISDASHLLLTLLAETTDALVSELAPVVSDELDEMLKEGGGLDTLLKRHFEVSPEDDIRAIPALTAALTGASNKGLATDGAGWPGGSSGVCHDHSVVYTASNAARGPRFNTALGPFEDLPDTVQVTKGLGTDAPLMFVFNSASELGLLLGAILNCNRRPSAGGTEHSPVMRSAIAEIRSHPVLNIKRVYSESSGPATWCAQLAVLVLTQFMVMVK